MKNLILKKFLHTFFTYFLIIIFNFSYADDLYIRNGIHGVLHTGGAVDYIGNTYGQETKKITLDYWYVISSTLDQILSLPNIPGFHVIHQPVTGALMNEGVARRPAENIGLGIQEYARGAR